jgi:DNA polymerase I-like protein with 3'-5' exonuclease and polymerase domains
MAFSLNKKASSSMSTPLWRIDHVIGNEFITVLLDKPIRSTSKDDMQMLKYVQTMLEKKDINSYVITSALRDYPTEIKGGLTEFYIKHDSKWFDEIIKPARAKGMTADVVIAYGAAFYQITKATDVIIDDLIYPYFENYIYIGHGWIGDYDCFVYPMFTLEEIFKPGRIMGDNNIYLNNWKMNFMVSIFGKIAKHTYKLPDEMEDVKLVEIGADYENNKEAAVKEVKEFLTSHFNEEMCAFDLETSGFAQWKDKIRCITLAFDSITGYYIEWKIFEQNPELIKLLSEMMKSAKHRITVNGKFDIKFLWVNGLDLDVNVTDDAMTLSHVLCSGRHKGLKTMTYYWTPFGGYDNALDTYRDNLKAKGNKDPSYYDIPKKILFPYATMDAVMTIRTFKAAEKRCHDFDYRFPSEIPIEHTGGKLNTAWEWYKYIMMLYPIICKMEYNGLCIDMEVVERHREIFKKEIEEQREKLGEIFKGIKVEGKYVDKDYDFGSAVQLGKLLEAAGWSCHGRSKHGEYATSDECFTEWKRENMKGVKELIKFRAANNALGTYLGQLETKVDQKKGTVKKEWSGWPQYIIHDEVDGTDKIHCNFGVCAAETFRMISREPNLQNVPTRSLEGQIVKMCFTVPSCKAYFITDENGKEWEVTQLGVINTTRGYVAASAMTEEDTVVDIGEKTVLEWDEWTKEGISPIGVETMRNNPSIIKN